MSESGSASSIATATMTGDLRDYFLAQVKSWSDTPWQKRPAAEQRSIANQIDAKVREAVRGTVELIAANGAKPVRGNLARIAAAKGMLQLTVDVIRTEEGRHSLVDGVGSAVLVMPAGAEQYIGERAPAEIDKDQPELLSAAE